MNEDSQPQLQLPVDLRCKQVKNHLPDYLEGDLSLDDRASVDEHIGQCADCAIEVHEMEETILLLRGLPEPETPPMIAANVMRRIRSGEADPGFWARVGRGFASVFEPSFVLPASAMAVAALAVVTLQDPSRLGIPAFQNAETSGAGIAGAVVAPLRSDSAGGRLLLPADAETGGARKFVQIPLTRMSAEPRRDVVVASPFTQGFVVQGGGGAPSNFRAPMMAGGAPPAFFAERPAPLIERPSPGTRVPRSGFVGAVPVAGPVPVGALEAVRSKRGRSVSSEAISAGGEDARDGWIAIGLQRPTEFARFLNAKTLAEQELWVERLAERAESRGLLVELVGALDSSGDAAAGVLAGDFRAARNSR
ncbi:MAG: zf-HC2 domain-containing protein [Myxococcota bacterium]|jgi:anti-sigma factor RsiW